MFMMASEFGMRSFRAIKNMNALETVGILTPEKQYTLKYGGGHHKEMINPIYQELQVECRNTNIPLFVMEKMNSTETVQVIREWNPQLIIVLGWYHLIGKEILEIPSNGIIGLHSSLLPKYRGGAPLVWQIINGEQYAGISLFYMNEGVDAGDIVSQKKIRIEEDDTIATLYAKVEREGIALLKENLPLIAENCAPRKKQIGLSDKDIYPQRSPQDGIINWAGTSRQIYNFVRAQTKPYPGAFTYYREHKIIIWFCEVVDYKDMTQESGVILDIIMANGGMQPVVSTMDSKYAIKMKEFLVLDKEGQRVTVLDKFFDVGARFG